MSSNRRKATNVSNYSQDRPPSVAAPSVPPRTSMERLRPHSLQRPPSVSSVHSAGSVGRKERPTSALRVPSISRSTPLRPESLKRDERSLSRPQSSAQPPLPMMSSQRSRGLSSNTRLTPMSDTPLASRNKVVQITEEMKKERAKSALQQTLKDKQAA